MRHFGIFPTFITNDPRTLPDEVFTLLDNLVAFMFRNEDELRQLAKSGLVDLKSIYALKNLESRKHCGWQHNFKLPSVCRSEPKISVATKE